MSNVVQIKSRSLRVEVDKLRKEKTELLDRLALFSRQYEKLEKEYRVVKRELANVRRSKY